ncbi:cutinase transcription factor 1 beta [Uncinocarpus reesii 1704]|uniref:Cutinase transcription factor 1 beta n=1 Tax=Uncinocarpus reesii (strain UAMH 1704) TaxID=336963 RepID=C4JJ42_UNCRE|nr:cutinase transcription factor 1 beta [Uncinocarpus reesii 1704]EEP76800.1 cutinase transcription factor 1 beta [Uncinocarpus reesii 1704]
MVSAEYTEVQPQNKRKAAAAGLTGASRPVKRRASKACCCCRARKVRCDVVENGSPCTNCRLDEVECVVTESKRRKKSRPDGEGNKLSPECSTETSEEPGNYLGRKGNSNGLAFSSIPETRLPQSPKKHCVDLETGHHVPHLIYQAQGRRLNDDGRRRRMSGTGNLVPGLLPCNLNSAKPDGFSGSTVLNILPSPRMIKRALPDYLRLLPPKLQDADIDYLEAKGALTIPEHGLRNELLRSYIQWVHPYMPLLELDDFLRAIFENDSSQRISLLLFQAVMFAGTAFIDIKHLRAEGFESRRAARKAFFQRARLLYDFDYEADRISLVQSLLLMTYWYEMPDDQKDTWHWMGVSLSLAHTIGLHRDPASSNMDPKRQKLWKRIWWGTYTRDRLIALGMRRPTRIKDEDCDVPMLQVSDFDFKPMSPSVLQVLGDVELTHNVTHQRELAVMFIEKAKLCLCISHVLSAQYSVLGHKFGGTMETTMMLLPKKSAAETCEVRRCDDELELWLVNLAEEAQYRPPPSTLSPGDGVIYLHRALLSMVYHTTSSALHRPQVLPTTPIPTVEVELQALSRTKVRHAAVEITNIAQVLHNLKLTCFLPTTGVTVLLPAVIIHLLDIKSNDISVRAASLNRFYRCMQILQRLQEIYASADFATSFLEAAIRKAGIHVPTQFSAETTVKPTTVAPSQTHFNALTPPPDVQHEKGSDNTNSHSSIAALPTFSRPEETGPPFASTPPHSVGSENGSTQNVRNDDLFKMDLFASANTNPEPTLTEFMNMAHDADITQNDIDALINFEDVNGELFNGEEDLGINFSMANTLSNEDNQISLDSLNWMREFANGNLPAESAMQDAEEYTGVMDGADPSEKREPEKSGMVERADEMLMQEPDAASPAKREGAEAVEYTADVRLEV